MAPGLEERIMEGSEEEALIIADLVSFLRYSVSGF
jgi:hypothetical protein